MKKFNSFLLIFCIGIFALIGCNSSSENVEDNKNSSSPIPTGKTLVEYGGRASVKLITKEGKVIYIDPYIGNYTETADIILVTHEHDDHNQVSLVPQKDSTKTIRVADAIVDKKYQSFDVDGIKIKAVPAFNSYHPKNEAVGFVIEVDGLKLYHAGDTSRINEMSNLKSEKIDYAFLPYDGEFNMGPDEMMKCAEIINPKFIVPIHGISQKPESITLDNVKILPIDEKVDISLN